MNERDLEPEAVYAHHPGVKPDVDMEVGIQGGAVEVVTGATFGPSRRALRRLVREPTAMVALVYLLALVIATLTFRWWWPYDPTKGDFNNPHVWHH